MSIYLRNKIWWIKYTVSGRVVYQSLKTTDRKIAKYKEAKVIGEIAEGKLPAVFRKVKADVARAEYLKSAELSKRSGTLRADRARLRGFLAWAKIKELRQIDRKLVEGYLAYRIRDEKLKPATANHTLSIIRTWLNWCIAQGYLASNPAKGIRKFKVEQNPPGFLSKNEAWKLLEVAKDSRLYPMVATALYTGLRLGELLRLEWSDINFELNRLMVGNKKRGSTKSKKFRVVPLNHKLREILLLCKKKEGVCFQTPAGDAYNEVGPRKSFGTITKKAGLPGIGWHILRHTFASHLVMSGGDLVTISKLMGHADISTTMIYAHLSQKHTEKVIRKLDFWGQKWGQSENKEKKLKNNLSQQTDLKEVKVLRP